MLSASRQIVSNVEVVSVAGILGGMPVLSGTRVPAEVVRQYLIEGRDAEELYSDYP